MMNLKTSKGFSLVEVLIALIVMSVGMLGIAGLYVQSMQAGRSSMLRHHAVNLAGDIADRIRANPSAGAAYTAAAGANNNCVAQNTDCTIAEMAANDIFLWQQQAQNTLPGGDVTIVYDNAVSPPTYTITVTWSEAISEAWNNPGDLRTYQIVIPVMGL